MCRSLLISANARRRQQAERHAHPTVRVLAAAATSIASCWWRGRRRP